MLKMNGAPHDRDSHKLTTWLINASIVIDDCSIDDLILTDDFRADWRHRIEHLRDRDPMDFLGLLLDAAPDTLAIDDEDTFTVTRSGTTVGEWPSKAAIVADVAAFVTLQEWLPEWEELDGRTRDELVARLRIFLKNCPACDGALESESGANDDVPEIVCPKCGAALI